MNDDFKIGRGFAIGSSLLVLVLGAALIVLSACSQQPGTPDAPQPSGSLEAPKAPEVPKAPDSATNIMRIQDIDFGSYSRDLAKWVKLDLGENMAVAMPKIEEHFAPRSGTVEENPNVKQIAEKTQTEFSTFGAEGGKVTLVERINIKDDSVKAEQFYAIFKGKDDDFMLVDYGLKIKCQRGDNTQHWQTTVCP